MVSYTSENDSIRESVPVKTKSRTAKRKLEWEFVKSLDDLEAVKAFLKTDGNWTESRINVLKGGAKHYFRCADVKKRGAQCDAAIYVHYPEDNQAIQIYRTTCPHTHTEMANKRKFIVTEEDANEFKRLAFELKLNRIQLWEQLGKRVFENQTQCDNYIQRLKVKLFGSPKASVGEIIRLWKQDNKVPTDENEPFVVNYEGDAETSELRVFISTVKLLTTTAKSDHLAADATYKLVWERFPILVVGTTDAEKRFFLTGLAVCSGETAADFGFLFRSISRFLTEREISFQFR